MQKLITKYGLAAHLALVAVAPLVLSTEAVLWLLLSAVVWVLMEPSRIGDEMLHEARRRTFRALLRDPLFWTMVVITLAAIVRAVNGGVEMAYDPETTTWSLAKPFWPFLPGSTDAAGGKDAAAVAVMLVVWSACRNTLGKSSRAAFVLVASSLIGAIACVYGAGRLTGGAAVEKLLLCSRDLPVYFGSACGLGLVMATAVLGAAAERRWYKALPFLAIAIIGNGSGLFLFAPAEVQVVWAGAEIIVFLALFVYSSKALANAGEFKVVVFFGLAATLAGVAALSLLTEEELAARLVPWKTGGFLTPAFLESRDILSKVAFDAWKESPWLGGGLGAFQFELRFAGESVDWAKLAVNQSAAFNGYWNLLAERGILGALLMAIPAGLLLVTWVRRLIGGIRAFCWPHSLAIAGFVVVLAAALETMIDVSVFAPGFLGLLGAMWSVGAGAFPKERRSNG